MIMDYMNTQPMFTNKVIVFGTNDLAELTHWYLTNDSDYEIVEKAVYTKDEDLTFYISENNSTIGSISKDHVSPHAIPKEITVPAISLNTFIKSKNIEKIGLIKMDIEGAEYDIIDTLEDWNFDITDSFLIEFNGNADDKANIRKFDLLRCRAAFFRVCCSQS